LLEFQAKTAPARSTSPVPAGFSQARGADTMLEWEADQAADGALRHGGSIAGTPGRCWPVPGGETAAPGGRPLDPAVRGRLEQHFGSDFSHVRVHTDAQAARSAEALGARAFTRHGDIVFAPGQYAPHTAEGERLLAHELAHVVQQATRPAPAVQLQRAHAPATVPVPKIDLKREIDRWVVTVDGQPVAEVKTQDEKTLGRLDITVAGDTVQVVLRHQGGAMLAAVPPPSNMSSRFQVDLREIDERPSAGQESTPSGPGGGQAAPSGPEGSQAEPTGSVPVQVLAAETVPWRGDREGTIGPEVHTVTRSPDTEFEQRMKRDPSLVTGVILDPETSEVIGYTRSSGGVTSYFDREGGLQTMSEIGLEQPPLDPIDLIPTPGEALKISAGIAGKVGVKALAKKAAAAEGTRLSMAVIVRMRGVSRALLRRAAREAAAESAGLVRRVTVDGLNHSFDRHAAQWFGRQVARETHFAAWRAVIERAAASKTVFAWSAGAAETVAHLAYIDGKPFVVQFFRETGELATAFVPNSDQLGAMLRLVGRAR
jgi:hypothetical protein